MDVDHGLVVAVTKPAVTIGGDSERCLMQKGKKLSEIVPCTARVVTRKGAEKKELVGPLDEKIEERTTRATTKRKRKRKF